VNTFGSPLEAKEFFVAKIVEQAQREGTSFSELERKMLYFTETGSDAKPEYMEVIAQFSEQYDDSKYEQKVGGLLKRAFETDLKQATDRTEAQDTWRSAFELLRTEDHYILVMIEQAFGGRLRKKLFGLF
jgi:hypothetical protein